MPRDLVESAEVAEDYVVELLDSTTIHGIRYLARGSLVSFECANAKWFYYATGNCGPHEALSLVPSQKKIGFFINCLFLSLNFLFF